MTPPSADASLSRASLLTPAGRGAVAVIGAEGPTALAVVDAHFRAANRKRIAEQPIERIVFGHWHDDPSRTGLSHGEEVVVCRTGPAALEVHCHGGLAAASRIIAAFTAAGCSIEPWTAWLWTHRSELLQAEADLALSSAATLRTAAILLDQRHGALRRAVESVRENLNDEAPDSRAAALRKLSALLDRAWVGLRLTVPWHVAIAGRPNVGKSSLINALVGYQRAIVFDQPGTTRDVLAAETAIDGWPVRLTDAAGFRTSADPLEAAGVDLAMDRARKADLVVWLLDASALNSQQLDDPAAAAQREMTALGVNEVAAALVVVNKSDVTAFPINPQAVRTCALTGEGLDALLAAIAHGLVPRPPRPGDGVPFTRRQADRLRTAHDHLVAGRIEASLAELARVLKGDEPAEASS